MRPRIRRAVLLPAGAVLLALAGAGLLRPRSPDEVIVFTWIPSDRSAQITELQGAPAGFLHPRRGQIVALDRHGRQKEPRVLTRGFASACAPSVSYDGRRILFAGKRMADDPWRIWEMGVDGSHPRQITTGAADAFDPCYLPDGRIVFSGPGADTTGVRSLFTCVRDRSRTERISFGCAQDVSPTVLPDGRILFTRIEPGQSGMPMVVSTDGTGLQRFHGKLQERPFLCRRPPGARTYGLYEIDPADSSSVRRLFEDAGGDVVDAVLAAPRPRPRALTSVVDAAKSTGWLLCLNVYQSELEELARSKPGDVQRVQVAAVNADRTERILGEAPVEVDGSFYLEVPADTLLRLRLLGSDGRLIASFGSGVWVRPNENRGCIGCHENPRLAPENRVPLAVTKPPAVIALSPGERRGE